MDNPKKIINHLGKNIQESYTMHELSKTLCIPYASFYRTVQKMKDILTVKAVGRSKTLQLNLKNPVIKAHLVVASDEATKEFLEKQPIINKIAKDLHTKDTVVLFGSYAKGVQAKKVILIF